MGRGGVRGMRRWNSIGVDVDTRLEEVKGRRVCLSLKFDGC